VDAFGYRNGRLHGEDVDLGRIAADVGTPAYVYSRSALVERFSALEQAFAAVPHLICYSAKANGNLAELRTLVEVGGGVDIVSGGELFAALRAGADPAKIVFAGVGKSLVEIEQALKAGILFFTVESAAELERIAAAAECLGTVGRFAVRVNPDVDAGTHHYVTTGTSRNKFGVDLDGARALYERSTAMAGVEAVAVQMHIGSQLMRPEPYVEAIAKLVPVVEDLKRRGIRLRYFDVGGGFGIRYGDETPASADEFASAIVPVLQPLGLTVVLEPGRFIVGNSGVLLTRVEYVKRTPEKTFVIVDAAMNDLIRPALYGASHRVVPVKEPGGDGVCVDVVGPVCESADFFAQGIELPELREGELLAILGAGAYAAAMGSTYNARPLPPEVLVAGGEYRVVRARQTFEQLFSTQMPVSSRGAGR
jgi:diaminopimelate decarboxylase